MNDKAIDNLWISKTDYIGGSLATTPYATVQKDPNNVYNTKNGKIEGAITYVKLWAIDPKTNKKVPAGFKRYLKGSMGKYNYFDPMSFEPYYENIKNNPSKYSADLIALADKKMHDNATMSFDGQRNMDIEQTDLDLGADGSRWFWDGLMWKEKSSPSDINKKLSFSGEGGNPNWQWIERPIGLIDNQNSVYSGAGEDMEIDFNADGLDESMMGACGENVNVMKNYVAPKVSNATGDEYHNSIGSWAKGIFSTPDSGITKDDAAKIADPKKTELTAAEMAALYKKSGSKKSFKDWYAEKGQGSLAALSNVILTADTLLGKQQQGKSLESNMKDDSAKGQSDSVTIMGMHPLTFGVVAVLSFAIIGVVGYKLLNKGK